MIKRELVKKLDKLCIEFEGRVFVYGDIEIKVSNMRYWDDNNEDIEFMCEINGYIVRDGILRDSNIDLLKSQIEEIISINSFGMGLRG